MLTYRQNRTGEMAAAYLGHCRVGYLVLSGDWLWNTNLLRPEGGVAHGRCASREGAEQEITAAVTAWLDAAAATVSHEKE